MTRKSYLADPKLEGVATLTEIIAGDKPIIRISETWFHPQGGGQKADRGRIGGVNVLHVAHNTGDVDHYVDSISDLTIGQTYPIQVDPEWRKVNAIHHTAGHLIASVVDARIPLLKAVSGHQWPGEGRVEFEGPSDNIDEIRAPLDGDLAEAISRSLAVKVVGNPFTDRAVQIGEFIVIPCGGTHVTATDELGAISVHGVKKKGGRLRISYSVAIP